MSKVEKLFGSFLSPPLHGRLASHSLLQIADVVTFAKSIYLSKMRSFGSKHIGLEKAEKNIANVSNVSNSMAVICFLT